MRAAAVTLLLATARAELKCSRVADCARSVGASCAAEHLTTAAGPRAAAAGLVAALNDVYRDRVEDLARWSGLCYVL